MNTAYSYTRISTPQQLEGHGLKRQTESTISYCSRHNLTLDTRLKLVDSGLSAYHGRNISVGMLGVFLVKVRSGEIQKGSSIIFESLDRLSRQDGLSALSVFSELISAGITVVTLMPEREYSQQSIKDNQFALVEIVTTFIRANEESNIKSERVGKAWANKRKDIREGRKPKLTLKGPEWLEWVNGKWRIRATRARVIRQIYQWALDGHGKAYITRRLNERRIVAFRGGKWETSSVGKLLHNRELIGECQPHILKDGKRESEGEPVLNLFPPVIDTVTFHAVQQRARSNPIKGGPPSLANLFTGKMSCGLCGGSMVYVNKGKSWQYLVCSNAQAHAGCEKHSVHYAHFESSVLQALHEIDMSAVLSKSNIDTKAKDIRKSIDAAKSQIVTHSKKIRSLVLSDIDVPEVKTQIIKLSTERDNLTKQIEKQQSELDTLTMVPSARRQALRTVEELYSKLDGMSKEEKYAARIRLRTAIQTIVDVIYYEPRGMAKMAGELLRDGEIFPKNKDARFTRHELEALSKITEPCVTVWFSQSDRQYCTMVMSADRKSWQVVSQL
jgi:DNA invertase Pin-like site-specific DNA recombinase